MGGKITFLICFIITLWAMKLLSLVDRLDMGSKMTFLSCFIITLWALKLLYLVYRLDMDNKTSFHCCFIIILWALKLLSLVYVQQDFLSEWLHNHILGTETFSPCMQIFYC